MGKILRFLSIFLLSISALFNIMGGIGTTCVALNPTGYGGNFDAILRMQWLYIIFVIVTSSFGVMMSRAVFLVIKGRANAYRYSLISLSGAMVVGIIHIIASRSLRGASMPVDAVVYVTLITMTLFLLLKVTGNWEKISYPQSGHVENDPSAGISAFVTGILCFNIEQIIPQSHTINGINFADTFHLPMTISGWIFISIGCFALFRMFHLLLKTRKVQPAKTLFSSSRRRQDAIQ
jgi:hypothetical protein